MMFNLDTKVRSQLGYKAYFYLLAGHKIQSVEWQDDKYIYMENNVIYDMNDNQCLKAFSKEEINGKWNVKKEGK